MTHRYCFFIHLKLQNPLISKIHSTWCSVLVIALNTVLFEEWLALIVSWSHQSVEHSQRLYIPSYTRPVEFLAMATLFFALFVFIMRLLKRNHRVIYESNKCVYTGAAGVEITALSLRSLYSVLAVAGITKESKEVQLPYDILLKMVPLLVSVLVSFRIDRRISENEQILLGGGYVCDENQTSSDALLNVQDASPESSRLN